jgi:DNA-binding winged helix-turn-helix (wHTH) protein
MPTDVSPEVATAHGFSIDRANQQLWNGETPAKVPPKVFQLLLYLRDNPGRIIEYDELLDAVWPREFVQPEILKTYVKTIRRLLNDDAHAPRFIETRARCGYTFIGQLPDRGAHAAPSRLIGRDHALAALQATLRAAEGGKRRVVFVVGEAGIGKTRLIDEFLARAAQTEPAVLRVDCAQSQYAAHGFSPVRELSHQLASRGTQPEAPRPAIDRADQPEALCRELEALAAAKPTILVVENLQWADVPTIEVLSRLAHARASDRLLVVASYRAAMPNDLRCPGRTLILDLLVHEAAQELRLAALASDEVHRLVLQNTTEALPRGAVEAIDRYAGGNPLIVSVLVERMVEQLKGSGSSELIDMLARHEHECEFVPDAVPDVIRHSLELQLRQLGERARSVLECGSNSGFAFCAWGVSRVLETEQVEIEELCRAMCGSDQMLRESGLYVFPDGRVTPVYSFRNRLYARLLLTAQSPARRDVVQQRFTEAVEQVWGSDVGSVALEMTERFEAVREWSRALHYAKLAVQPAR